MSEKLKGNAVVTGASKGVGAAIAVHLAARERDICLENFAAELTEAAYPIVLRHGAGGSWVDLELDLWRVLAETVKTRSRGVRPARSQSE